MSIDQVPIDPVLSIDEKRATPEEIKQWYGEVAVLLNRLEMAGERLQASPDTDLTQIAGQTGIAYKTVRKFEGTWSWQ